MTPTVPVLLFWSKSGLISGLRLGNLVSLDAPLSLLHGSCWNPSALALCGRLHTLSAGRYMGSHESYTKQLFEYKCNTNDDPSITFSQPYSGIWEGVSLCDRGGSLKDWLLLYRILCRVWGYRDQRRGEGQLVTNPYSLWMGFIIRVTLHV